MWGVMLFASAVVGALGFVAVSVWLVRLFLIAPTGYQNDDGFHLGDEPFEIDPNSKDRLARVRRPFLAVVKDDGPDGRADPAQIDREGTGSARTMLSQDLQRDLGSRAATAGTFRFNA